MTLTRFLRLQSLLSLFGSKAMRRGAPPAPPTTCVLVTGPKRQGSLAMDQNLPNYQAKQIPSLYRWVPIVTDS